MAHEGNKGWLRKWLHFEPHQIIGSDEDPYLRRWYVIPRNRVLNIYLHHFLRSDDDRALHDHPWPFISMVLKGGYWEHRQERLITTRSYRQSGTVAFRRSNTAHRVELERDDYGVFGFPKPFPKKERPAWTLILTGPRMRRWGFYCPKGWVHWETFDHQNGCGEHAA